MGVAVADGTLWVGAASDEVPDGESNVGSWWQFAGDVLVSDVETDAASGLVEGVDPGGFFGTALGAVGDTNGDGSVEWVVVATRDDAFGVEAGAAYVVEDGRVRLLSMPGDPGGGHLGVRGSVGFHDPAGLGEPDLLGGAWGVPYDTVNDGGAAYRWSATGATGRFCPSTMCTRATTAREPPIDTAMR